MSSFDTFLGLWAVCVAAHAELPVSVAAPKATGNIMCGNCLEGGASMG